MRNGNMIIMSSSCKNCEHLEFNIMLDLPYCKKFKGMLEPNSPFPHDDKCDGFDPNEEYRIKQRTW